MNYSWVSKAEGKIKHKGALSRKARNAGMSTQDYACYVLKNSSDPLTRRQAQFYVNINGEHLCAGSRRSKKLRRSSKTKKSFRGGCWPGYHRVPGTVEYAKHSCAKN